MTFIELCQRTARECSVTGTGPSTAIAQTGELGRIVNWVAEANMEIERAHPDWMFMRLSTLFGTVAAQANYPFGTGAGTCGVTAATFGMWARDSFRNYPTASGNTAEIEMSYMEYDAWRAVYEFGATRYVQTQPLVVSFFPADQSPNVGPYPNGDYTVTGNYFRQPILLAADADIPGLPPQFHMMVVYKAMMYYGAYEGAPEVYDRGEMEFDKNMRRLDALRLPEIRWG